MQHPYEHQRAMAMPASESLRGPVTGQVLVSQADPRFQRDTIVDRRTERLAAAERSLADAYASMRAARVDPDAVDTAFAIARDCLAEAKECSAVDRKELAWAQRERLQAQRDRLSQPQHSDTAPDPVVLDAPGSELCPNPAAARTPAELMEALRTYRIWAGEPSYRAMERQCGRRFAASTLHTALHSDDLPGLQIVQAIITACGGSIEHRQAFASAWRRLKMPQHSACEPAVQPPRSEASLYPVSESA
jgi:hypothetical protein